MYNKEMLKEIVKSEQELQFDSFTNKDAYDLGNLMLEIGKDYPKAIAVRVYLDKYIAYQYLNDGTMDYHCWWMDRKQNLVERAHKSSLRCAIEKEFSFKSKKWWKNEKKYAFCGGGFPIVVNGQYKGVAICSGLTDLEDNEIVVKALKMLKQIKSK